MTEQELRALVREAIARHVGAAAPQGPTRAAPNGRLLIDPAHAMFRLERAADDSACIIEPSVACTHCGYCKSYGH